MRSRPAARAALLPVLLPVLLLPVACGGDDGAITAKSSTTAKAATVELDPKVCDAVEGSDLPDDFASMLPDRFASAAGAVQAFAASMAAESDDLAPGTAAKLADALGADGAGDDLVALGDAIVEQCGASEGAQAFRYLGGAAKLVAVPKDAEYCAALVPAFDTEAGTDDAEQLQQAIDAAPEEHRVALELLAKTAEDSGPPTDDAALAEMASAFMGIGLYAEARCGVEGAFGQMMLAVAFMGMSNDSPEGEGDGDGQGGETGTEPTPADPGAADAVAPSGTTFEAVRVDLEEDGEYLASVVVPSGWTQSNDFNVTFDPPTGGAFSIFTSLEVAAGCDGMCSPTDWEARLRGADGYLTNQTDGWSVTEDRAPEGSEGAVVTATKDDGSALVLVLRWDDDADRYFQCKADLDADDAALGPALLAACEASRPGWIPVG